MKVDAKIIEKLERLSKIELSGEEREEIARKLDRIISYMDMLSELEGEGSSVFHGVSSWEELREDEEGEGLKRDDVLSNAPDPAKGFFRVPGIIEPD